MRTDDDLLINIPLLELKDFNMEIEECVSYTLNIVPSTTVDENGTAVYLHDQGKWDQVCFVVGVQLVIRSISKTPL